jgi:hypothetical protein
MGWMGQDSKLNSSGEENEVTVTTTQCIELYSSYEPVFQNDLSVWSPKEKYPKREKCIAPIGAYKYVYRHQMRLLHAT